MDISVVITLVAAALLIQLLLPHPRFVKAHKQYDLPDPSPDPPVGPVPVKFSLLVPLRYEPDVDDMLAELLTSPRRDFEILLLVGPDDSKSSPACRRLSELHPDRVRVVDGPLTPDWTMAAALNAAIPHCYGDVIGVIGGGDPVRASLLDRVDGAYQASGVDIVRVALDFPEGAPTSELYWLMHGMVCVRGIRPVRVTKRFHLTPSAAYFVRTDLLRVLGGWDMDSRSEELELLLRLSSFGASDAMLYGEPARHNAPWSRSSLLSARGWKRLRDRRVRWYTTLLLIHRTREWRRFPTVRKRLAAHDALVLPIVQALLAFPALVVSFLLPFAWPDQSVYRFALPLWVFYVSVVATVAGADWLRNQSRAKRSRLLTLAEVLNPPALMFRFTVITGWSADLVMRQVAAQRALWRYLRSDTKVLRDHFERSRREPPQRPARSAAGSGPNPAAAEPDPPAAADLLAVAGSPDTPAAVQAMATGLDALFRALGPPPESLRLAEAGPTPQGDGGTSDG
ncbi:hypothetical protein [Streptomyces sp. NPDC060031]|uniref:hypothetical protein n=1 Tax=Streptomyces sp. NPDC060031 TaxID=3347043 RepID=UPI003695E474